MRQRADWMTAADDRILECVAVDGWHTPADVERTIRASVGTYTPPTDYIAARCRVLADYGLAATAPTAAGYALTRAGERYLAGDLDPSTLD